MLFNRFSPKRITQHDIPLGSIRAVDEVIVDPFEFLKTTVSELLEQEKADALSKYQSPYEAKHLVNLEIPVSGIGEQVYSQLRRIVMATPRTSSHRFFNQLFGGRVTSATIADMLTTALNNSMYTYKAAGIQILVEQVVIDALKHLVGFHDGEGIFAPGGAISNLAAMIVARNEAQNSVRDRGISGSCFTAYTSDQSHYSIQKNAGIIGCGRDNVRIIPSDNAGKMRVDILRTQITEDRQQGCVPYLINATAGTTVLGAIDPIADIVDVAREHNVWCHVDGAWGGSMLLSSEYRTPLDACADADSFVWNVHKMMGVPLQASVILIRAKGKLKKHFSEQADYLFQSEEDDYNPGMRSIQCGRRNDALKVWAAWQYYGHEGYERRVNIQMELAIHAVENITTDAALRLCMMPESPIVCFQVRGAPSKRICAEMDRQGIAKIGYGHFKGEDYIRLVCVNPDLTFDDIDHLIEQTKRVGDSLA